MNTDLYNTVDTAYYYHYQPCLIQKAVVLLLVLKAVAGDPASWLRTEPPGSRTGTHKIAIPSFPYPADIIPL